MNLISLLSTYARPATQKIASALCVGGATLQICGMATQNTGKIIEHDSKHKTIGKVIEVFGHVIQSFTTYLIIGPFSSTFVDGVIGSIIVLHPLILKQVETISKDSDTAETAKKWNKVLDTATKIFNFIGLTVLAAIAAPSLELGVAVGSAAYLGWHCYSKVSKEPNSWVGKMLANANVL